MIKRIWILYLTLWFSIFAVTVSGYAVTPRQLHEILDRGDNVTIIDIRNRYAYSKGHILGAININAKLVAKKQFPALGNVIVYGDGIQTVLTNSAVRELNNKNGIQAEMLEGGFSAWEALSLPNTLLSGFQENTLNYQTYQNLKRSEVENSDMILVDLRSEKQGKISNLSKKFSRRKIIKLTRTSKRLEKTWDVSKITTSMVKDAHHSKLYVLVDDGDGEAAKVAYRLRAAGIRRVVILIGGEHTLRRDGLPGFKRNKSR